MHYFSFRDKKYFYDETSGKGGLQENAPATPGKAESQGLKPSEKNPDSPVRNTPVTHIALFITQQCNLRCIYCYGGGGDYGSPGIMREETALQAIKWLIRESGDADNISMELFGGEPLLNWPLVRFVAENGRRFCKEHGKKLSLTLNTNGTLLTEDKIRYCIDHQVSLIIGFDGSKRIQDRNRPCRQEALSSYDLAVANLKRLLELYPDCHCRATIIPDTDIDEVADEIEKIGFKWYQFVMASKSVHLGETGHGANEDVLERMQKRLVDDIDKLTEAIDAGNRDLVSVLSKRPPMPLILSMLGNGPLVKRHFGCAVGKSGLGITVNGDIYPCHRFAGLDSFRLGNIASEDWHRTSFDVSPLEMREDCMRCWARYLCGGGCAYVHFASTGSMDKVDELFCRLQRFALEMAVVVSTALNDKDIEWLEKEKLVLIKRCFLDLF